MIETNTLFSLLFSPSFKFPQQVRTERGRKTLFDTLVPNLANLQVLLLLVAFY